MRDDIIVPSAPLDLPGWPDALKRMDELENRLAPLSERAKELVVNDALSFAVAGEIIAELKSLTKQSEATMEPFKLIVRRVLDFIQQRFNKNKNYAETIHALLSSKMGEYSRAERAATAAEQKKLDRKGVEGTVEPNIPKTAGVRQTVNYPITIEDNRALLRALLKAYKATDTKRVQFLSQFVTLNESELRSYAKELKNPEQFAKDCPGVTCKEAAAFGGKV